MSPLLAEVITMLGIIFPSSNKPGAYQLALVCRYPHQHHQIWWQWWRQFGFTISLGRGHHLLSPCRPFPEVPRYLIFCSPVGWRVILKGVKSNKSWFKHPFVNRLYARILFPKIVENKEFPHYYKKDDLPTSIGYLPDTLGQERTDF